MKKVASLAVLCLLLAGCSQSRFIRIPAHGYLAAVEAVYANPAEHIGKTVTLDGVFTAYETQDGSFTMVYRFNADDEPVGFELVYGGAYPENFSWVHVEGTLDSYEADGQVFLRILAEKLEVTAGGEIEAD